MVMEDGCREEVSKATEEEKEVKDEETVAPACGCSDHSEICGMRLVKVPHRRHQWFFLVPISALTSVPT